MDALNLANWTRVPKLPPCFQVILSVRPSSPLRPSGTAVPIKWIRCRLFARSPCAPAFCNSRKVLSAPSALFFVRLNFIFLSLSRKHNICKRTSNVLIRIINIHATTDYLRVVCLLTFFQIYCTAQLEDTRKSYQLIRHDGCQD